MNKSIKKKWVAALRSGEYQQGQGLMCHEGKYCCLGVLCDILPKPAKKGVSYLEQPWHNMPKPSVLESIGISSGSADELVRMNDGGNSFKIISRYIGRHL